MTVLTDKSSISTLSHADDFVDLLERHMWVRKDGSFVIIFLSLQRLTTFECKRIENIAD